MEETTPKFYGLDLQKIWLISAGVILVGIVWFVVTHPAGPSAEDLAKQREAQLASQHPRPDVGSAIQNISNETGGANINDVSCGDVSGDALTGLGDTILDALSGDIAHHDALLAHLAGDATDGETAVKQDLGKIFLDCAPDDSSPLVQNGIVAMGHSANFGDYMTDVHGMTLYYYAKDVPKSGETNCYADCANNWPPLAVTSRPNNLSDYYGPLDVIARTDGTYQFTWKGKPLYLYSSDSAVGDTGGQGVNKTWYVVQR